MRRRASARAASRDLRAPSSPRSARRRRCTASRSCSCSPRNGYRKLDAPAVVDGPRRAPLEQAAMLEEDVDQLPQHVVERLDQLLADERVVARRLELPFRAGRRERDREAAARRARSRAPPRSRGRRPERDHDVVRLRQQLHLLGERRRPRARGRSPAAPACRRSPGGRTRPRRGARPTAPPASGRARSAARRARSARPSGGRAARSGRPPPRRSARSPPSAARAARRRSASGAARDGAASHAAPRRARRSPRAIRASARRPRRFGR